MTLIEKRLSKIQNGKRLILTYSEGDSVKKVEGVVEENDGEAALAILSGDEELIITYLSVSSFRFVKDDEAAPQPVPQKPPVAEEKNDVKEAPQPEPEKETSDTTPSSEPLKDPDFLPEIRIEATASTIHGKYNVLPDDFKGEIHYNFAMLMDFMESKRGPDLFKAMQQAASIESDVRKSETFSSDLMIWDFVGYLNTYVRVYSVSVWRSAQNFSNAAMASYLRDSSAYLEYGSLALITLATSNERQDEMLGLLCKASARLRDFSGFEFLLDDDLWSSLSDQKQQAVFEYLYASCGKKLDTFLTADRLLDDLMHDHTDRRLINYAMKIYQDDTGENLLLIKESFSKKTGTISRVSWASERAYITSSDGGTYEITLQDIKDNEILTNKLKKLFREHKSTDFTPINVEFGVLNKKPVAVSIVKDLYAGRTPLQVGRSINTGKLPDRFSRSLSYFYEALKTPDRFEAFREIINNYMTLSNNEGTTAYLIKGYDLYIEMKDELPQNFKYFKSVFELTIKLKKVDDAIDLFEKLYNFEDSSMPSNLANCYALAVFLLSYGTELHSEEILEKCLYYFDFWKKIYDENKSLPEICNNAGNENTYYQVIPYRCALVHYELGNYDTALELAKEAIRYSHSDECVELINRLRTLVNVDEEPQKPEEDDSDDDGSDEVNPEDTTEDTDEAPIEKPDDDNLSSGAPAETLPEDDEPEATVQDTAEEEEEKSEPCYVDPAGLNELGLTEDDIIGYALSLLGESKVSEAAAYLKAAAPLSDSIANMSNIVSYAVNSPLENISYNASEIIENLSGYVDEKYLDFVSLAKLATYIRSLFADTIESESADIYTIKGLGDSIEAPASVKELFTTLFDFKTATGHGMDYFACDSDDESDNPLKRAVDNADATYPVVFSAEVTDNSPMIVRKVRQILLGHDKLLETLTRYAKEDSYADAAPYIMEFKEKYIKRGMPVSSENIDKSKIDDAIDQAWAEARTTLHPVSVSDTIRGARRNNLIIRITKAAEAIAEWLEASKHFLDREDMYALKNRYLAEKRPVCDLIRQITEDLIAAEGDIHTAAGYELLRATTDEIEFKLDGLWTDNNHSLFFADFLRTDNVMLDENFLPDLTSTFFSLDNFDILSRIRTHVASKDAKLNGRFEQIFRSADKLDLLEARLICEYSKWLPNEDEYVLPQTAEEFAKTARLRTENEYRAFLRDYAMSVSKGRIFVSDSFMSSLPDTVTYWYNACMEAENFGFFFRLISCCREKISNDAKRYENELRSKLAELMVSRADLFGANSQAGDDIGRLISEQNFIVAEDRMNRIKKQDFIIGGTTGPDPLECLNDFCAGYNNIYSLVNESTVNLSLLFRSFTSQVDDTSAGRLALVNNWFTDGSLTADNVRTLLMKLDWPAVNVERMLDNKYDIFRVSIDPMDISRHLIRHPIAVFGSQMNEREIFVVCIRAERTQAQLLSDLRELDQRITGNKIVLYANAIKLSERRELARLLKQRPLRNIHIIIDKVMMYYLAQNYVAGETGRLMLRLAMPFTYYQPYVAESSHPMPPEMFIGREDELRSIESPEGASLVYGGRQLGKSALLRRAGINVNAKTDGSRAVLVEIKDRNISQAARRVSLELYDNGIISRETDSWEDLSHILISRLRCTNGERPIPFLLLMIDEADTFLEQCKEVNYAPITFLKDVQTSCEGKFKFVLAGTHNLVRFSREDSLSENSVIPHFTGSEIIIRPFTHEEGQELMSYPMSYLGFTFGTNTELTDFILATTNYFPGLIQLYCQKLIESLSSEQYAGYNSSDSPPYRITSQHIGRIISDPSFRDQIREKFEITLKLDKCFYMIALLMALLYDQTDAEGDGFEQNRGYTVEDIKKAANDNCCLLIDEMSPDLLKAWMLDLCDLNILAHANDDEHFLFSTKSFRDLLGSKTRIIAKLNELV